MIQQTNGDILANTNGIICHQVNCRGVMGAGLAKQIKEKYPKVFEWYKHYCESISPLHLLGYAQLVTIGKDKAGNSTLAIANLFAQDNYGRTGVYTDYKALEKCFVKVHDIAKEHKLTVYLPYGIGCGLAGGDWEKVEKLINKIFGGTDVQCTIVKLKK